MTHNVRNDVKLDICSFVINFNSVKLLVRLLIIQVNGKLEEPLNQLKESITNIICTVFMNYLECKVWTFWEAHKIWKNLPHGLDVYCLSVLR